MANKKSAIPMDTMIHVHEDVYKMRTLYRGQSFNRYFVKTKCNQCGKEFFRDRPNSKKSIKGYCSKECTNLARKGEGNCNWSGGVKNKRGANGGHLLEYAPTHPNARKGFVAQHRLIVEKKLGRLLLPAELVHHINCDMQDNAPDNLIVNDLKTHNNAHASLERCVKKLLKSGILIFNKTTMEYEVTNGDCRD